MEIGGFLKTSLIEWPGKMTAVIFVPGCNFRCPFCHNADLVEPKKIKKLEKIEEREVLRSLKERKKWLEGVVVTGGEPTLQPDLGEFLKKIKGLGFGVMVETNGSRPEVLEKLIEKKLIDFVAMDYKTIFEDYGRVTGAFLGKEVKKSMRRVGDSGLPFELRTTVVPGIHNERNLRAMGKDLRKLGGGSWVLQPFRPKDCLEPKFNKLKPYMEEELKGFLKGVKKVFPRVRLRGI